MGAGVVFVLVSNLSGSADADCSDAETEHDGSGFAFCAPGGWEQQAVSPFEAFYAAPEDGDDYVDNINVYAERLPEGMELQEYYDTSVANAERTVTDWHVLRAGAQDFGGQEALWHEYTARQGIYTLHGWQAVFVVDGWGYAFTYDSSADGFAAHIDEARASAHTLVFA